VALKKDTAEYGRIYLKDTTRFASCLTLESAMAAEPIHGCIFRPTHKQLLSLRAFHRISTYSYSTKSVKSIP
jgi:hypothetical protein